MPLLHSQMDLEQITFAALSTNGNGGKYVSIAHAGERPWFQLGDKNTLTRVAFVPEQDRNNVDKWTMKIEINGTALEFIRGLEAKVVEAGCANAESWFKRGTFVPSAHAIEGMFNSKLKDSTKAEYPDPTFNIRVHPSGEDETEVYVAASIDEIGAPTKGALDDIAQGDLVLPILRTKGGVYFLSGSFGLSFEATGLLVVKQARGTKRKLGLSGFKLD